MKITNVYVSNLAESIVASGFPMLKKSPTEQQYIADVNDVEISILSGEYLDNKHFKRAITLANSSVGSGHNCFLKGIIVSFNLNAPQYFWQQWQRYHFADIVSSMSKMHRLTDLVESDDDTFSRGLSKVGKDNIKNAIDAYTMGEMNIDEVLANVPMGLEYTARVTTNYLQLKSMYIQRRNHRSKEWQQYCDWIEELPFANLLITGKK